MDEFSSKTAPEISQKFADKGENFESDIEDNPAVIKYLKPRF